MMNTLISKIIQFVLLVLFQVLILNNLEVGFGLYIMVYPLFIFSLPYQMNTVTLMLVAFACGLIIDSFSNTFGLHASSSVLIAYLRPLIFKWIAPRDSNQEIDEVSVDSMGRTRFFYAYALLLLVHNTWFFLMESFKVNELGWVLLKVILSVPSSFLVSLFIQYIFLTNRKKG